MATYKLIQDVEAEDHILGPLTLRQFLFGLGAALLYYLSVLSATHSAAFLLVVLVPIALFCTFFAFPFGKDQSTEVWALAKLRFFLKPRKRIWDQSGIKQLVTVTAPKRIERVLTNGLSETEVSSRLHALANTLDSRGWAVKNVNVSSFSNPNPFMSQSSDRLIDMNSLPQEVPNYEIHASDDMLDATSSPVAQQFEQMIAQSEQAHRQQLITQLNSPAPVAAAQGAAPAPSSYWFMNQPTGGQTHVVADGTTPPSRPIANPVEEQTLAAQIKARSHKQDASYANMRTLQPNDSKPKPATAEKAAQKPQQPTSTPPTDPAILSLASNNDLNVSTLARQAKRARDDEQPPHDEVVISLR
jgi:hypothetical protein